MSGKPKPTNLKILNGNPGKRPLNINEPKPTRISPECPEFIQKDKIAYEEWKRIVPELERLGLLTIVDGASLEIICTQYSIYRKALKSIGRKKLTTFNIRNGEKALPQLAIAREAAKIIKAFCVEFGLTPSSRGRISLPSESLEDELKDLVD